MPHAYTEDQLVEQPALRLFAELGWQTVSAKEEVFGTHPRRIQGRDGPGFTELSCVQPRGWLGLGDARGTTGPPVGNFFQYGRLLRRLTG